jgi:hypothetical protein
MRAELCRADVYDDYFFGRFRRPQLDLGITATSISVPHRHTKNAVQATFPAHLERG